MPARQLFRLNDIIHGIDEAVWQLCRYLYMQVCRVELCYIACFTQQQEIDVNTCVTLLRFARTATTMKRTEKHKPFMIFFFF